MPACSAKYDDLFGSGSTIWNRELNCQLEFRYDDYLIEDIEGVLLRIRIDLGSGRGTSW